MIIYNMDVRCYLAWSILLVQVVVNCQNSPPSRPGDLQTYFRVYENASIGSVIYTLRVVDNDPNEQLTFSIATDATRDLVNLEPVFSVSANQWGCNITLKSQLDRDNSPSSRQLYFTVKDKDSLEAQFLITMFIIDVNDNPPSFVNLPYRISIREDYLVGSTVFKVSATDPDTDSGALVTYSITAVNRDYNNTFELGTHGNILLSKPLDYEKLSFYHYNVTAKDEGDPPCPGDTCQCVGSNETCNPGPVDLFITIIDVQDTPPIFDKLPYIGTVPESKTQGYSILQVTAADGDRGVSEPNLIQYSFTGGDSSSFVINETDGTISVKSTLDADLDDVRNKGGLYVFTVTATEVPRNGSVPTSNPNNSSSTSVSITVTDVNDNPPVFTASSYNASVQENTPSGVPIMVTSDINIEVYDKDQDMNSRFWVYLEKDGALYNDFETLPKQNTVIQGRSTITIRVVNSSALDYETTKIITFKIIARENNTNPNVPTSSEATVILYIEDTNDNSPYFPDQPTTFNVSEDEPVGYVIATVTATDVDSGDFGEVIFSLEDDGFDGTFNISENGLISLAKSIDREERQSYTIYVVASDSPKAHADQRRKTTKRIQIIVTDVNDNTPIWTQFIPSVSILESSEVGTKVTDLRAVDNDYGINSEIEYSISPGTNGSGLFNITMTNDLAEITIKESLIDHVGLHLVQVMAKDKGTPPLNATIDLSIFVIDENRNRPIFTSPDQNKYNFSAGLLPIIEVDEEQPARSELFILSATDKDIGQNGLVMYYLDPTTNKDYEYFTVDRISGTLASSDRRLDRERKETYEIQVRAEDNGQPAPLSTTLTMIVKLRDINDNQPKYEASMPQVLQVLEESSNAYIGQLLPAIDLDSYPNNVTCYYLYGGDHLSGLQLDRQSRSLSLTKKVDREVTDTLNIVVKASENCTLPSDFFTSASNIFNLSGPTLIMNAPPAYNSSDESLLWVKVTVIDINDNPPQFLHHDLSASAIFDVDVGTEVMSLADSITDKDTPTNRKNKFNLLSITQHLETGDSVDTSKEAFVVSVNGSVSTNIRFRSDLLGYFLLQVLAYDDDGMNDTANIKVFLISTLDRLILVFNKLPNEVEEIKDSFIRQLSDILKLDLVIDKIQSHTNLDGTRDPTRTDAYIHGRYRDTGKVVPAAELRQLIDFSSAARSLLMSSGVIEAKTLYEEKKEDEAKELRKIFAIAVSILAVIVVALFVVLLHMVRLYRRRLRAATTMAHASPNEKETLDHPGTNKYFASENPLYGKDIQQVDRDAADDDTSHNSLDLNAVDESLSSPFTQRAGPDEEQEMFMQITDNTDIFSTKNANHISSLDQVLQTYSNKAFKEDDDNDNDSYNNSTRSKKGETDLYDEIYDSDMPNFQTLTGHVEYTEI